MTQHKKNAILNNLQSLKYMGFEYLNSLNLNRPISNEQQLPNNLKDLQSMVSNCNLCAFGNVKTNTTFGIGNMNANILFLTLVPSYLKKEINDMFIKITQNVLNIPFDDIYLLNILKCNINSTNKNIDNEINICKPYFQKQIDIIQPKIIVTFGDAYKYLIKESKPLVEIRGIEHFYNNISVIPTYHPSYIIRNPSFKKDVFLDLQKVKILMESL